ncbi:hypothetical protein PZA11_004950 [Diplocarpon coronariae]
MKGYEGLGIKPKNVALNQLFGGFTGLSLIPITFDWTYVLAYLGDLLLAPVLAFVNALGGLVIFVIISVIGISCTGAFYSDYLPVKHLSDLRQHIVPTCMILATRNITLSLNAISPFLAGYMILGKPVGVIKLKVFSTICLGQA